MSVRERHRREREARSQAILAAAARVFARHGLEGATIEMVAREAEIAVGTIYLYFESRDDLYLTLTAERTKTLRGRYIEIQARVLSPLDELRAIAAAYLEYLSESRELFISQQSVSYARLEDRLKRPSELRHFRNVIKLGHEVFDLYAKTIRRASDAGLIAHPMGVTRTAAIIWATLNGAFMLMGNDRFFHNVTGLDPAHFIDEALESHLVSAQPAAAANGNGHRAGATELSGRISGRSSGMTGAPTNGRARNFKSKVLEQDGAADASAI